MTDQESKCHIFVLDDDQDFLDLASTLFKQYLYNLEFHPFLKYEDMVHHPDFKDAALIILDMDLSQDFDGIKAAKKIIKDYEYSKPFLFVSGNVDYDFEFFQDVYTYDFIRKPFTTQEFVNRIKVLLKVSNVYRRHETHIANLEMGISDLFSYSEIFMIILDRELNIRICSNMLAKELGYDPIEIIGKSWKDFIPNTVESVHECILDSACEDEYLDVTNEIITKDEKRILVRWFNTKVVCHDEFTFSIGIPTTFKLEETDPNKIRERFQDLLDRDKGIIKSLGGIKGDFEC